MTNSSAVCPMSLWSSVRSAGVNTSCGAVDSNRKLPPFAAGLERTELAMVLLLAGGTPWGKFKQLFEKKQFRDSTPEGHICAIALAWARAVAAGTECYRVFTGDQENSSASKRMELFCCYGKGSR